MSKVSVKINQGAINRMEKHFVANTLKLAGDIAKLAKSSAPVKSGNLAGSIRVQDKSANVILIIAGGRVNNYSVPYALRQEYENKRKSRYMRKSLRNTLKGDWVQEYYGGVV